MPPGFHVVVRNHFKANLSGGWNDEAIANNMWTDMAEKTAAFILVLPPVRKHRRQKVFFFLLSCDLCQIYRDKYYVRYLLLLWTLFRVWDQLDNRLDICLVTLTANTQSCYMCVKLSPLTDFSLSLLLRRICFTIILKKKSPSVTPIYKQLSVFLKYRLLLLVIKANSKQLKAKHFRNAQYLERYVGAEFRLLHNS
jgi:hypothetical protein